MKYKATSLAITVLLISTPVICQEISPIVVETPRTTKPTTIITGELLHQTYVVRYIDLANEGNEIVIQESGLKPDLLGNFDVLNLDIVKTTVQKEFLEHRWYLNYTFRIVNPKKGPYVIPPVTIPWVLKKIGQDISDPSLRVNNDFKTNEVHINYVTTIPAKETFFDVLDEINLGSFSWEFLKYKLISLFLLIVPSILFFWLIYQSRRTKKLVVSDIVGQNEESDSSEIGTFVSISRKQAFRNLKKNINLFSEMNFDSDELKDFIELRSKLSESLNDFLRAELSLTVGSTPAEMVVSANSIPKDNNYKKLLLSMSSIADYYYLSIQKNEEISADFISNSQILRECIKNLSWYRRFLDLIKRS